MTSKRLFNLKQSTRKYKKAQQIYSTKATSKTGVCRRIPQIHWLHTIVNSQGITLWSISLRRSMSWMLRHSIPFWPLSQMSTMLKRWWETYTSSKRCRQVFMATMRRQLRWSGTPYQWLNRPHLGKDHQSAPTTCSRSRRKLMCLLLSSMWLWVRFLTGLQLGMTRSSKSGAQLWATNLFKRKVFQSKTKKNKSKLWGRISANPCNL